MSIQAAQLVAKVEVSGDVEAKAKLQSVGKSVDDTGGKLKGALLGAGVLAGAALIGVGAAALKMAGDFQASMTQLVTGAGEPPKNIDFLKQKILDLSISTGTPLKQLTDGMFNIASAGFHGAIGAQALADAAMGAKVGAADLGVVADAETTIMTDFAKQHITAAQAVNTLVAIVSDGKTHMTDLAGSLSAVLPIASGFRIHLNDVAAAMATMTGEGTPAADAATYLRQTIGSLEGPGSKAVKTLKEIGLTSTQISNEMKLSMPGTLQLIVDHLKTKFPEGSAAFMNALKDIAGGQKTFQGMLELTGSHLDTLKSNYADITQKVKDGGSSIVGWTEVQKDFNFKLDQTHTMFDAMLVQVGQKLMPVVGDFMLHYVQPFIKNLQDWFLHGNNVNNLMHDIGGVIQTVSGFVGPLVTDVAHLVGWFQQAGPQGEIAKQALLGIAGAIAAIKVKDMIGDFAKFATDTIPKIVTAIGQLTGANGFGSIKAAAQGASDAEAGIGKMATGQMATDVTAGAGIADGAIAGIGTTADGTTGIVAADAAKMDAALSGIISKLAGLGGLALGAAQYGQSQASQQGTAANQQYTATAKVQAEVLQEWEKTFPNLAMAPGSNPFARLSRDQENLFFQNWLRDFPGQTPPYMQVSAQGFASGVTNFQGGLAYVHQGELLVNMPQGTDVIPAGQVGGGGQTIVVNPNLYIDGMLLTQGLMPYIANAIRYATGSRGL